MSVTEQDGRSLASEVVDLQSRIEQVRARRISRDVIRWDALGELFRHRRIELHLSEDAVAEAIDGTRAAIAGVEAASMRLTMDGFVAYCHALQLDPHRVLRHAVE